jgi:uncharacterized repeat protein (TIGR01451 family)
LRSDAGAEQKRRGSRTLLTWDLGTLAPGQRRTIDYQAFAKQTGTFTNQAIVTASGGLRQESASVVVVRKPDLALTMTGPARRYANLPAAYELTVSNPGTAPVTNVLVRHTLPAQARLVRATAGARQAGQELQWPLGTLRPGERRVLQLVLSPQAPGEVVNRATAMADRGLTSSAEVRTLFEGIAGLTIRVRDEDPVDVGREFSYVVVVRNTGTADATNVQLTATVPEQTEVTDTSGPGEARRDGRKVTFKPLTLKPGQEALYRIFVVARRPGDGRFRAELSADQLTSGPIHEEESTTIYQERAGPP